MDVFSCRGLALFSIAQVFLHPTVSPVLLPKPLCFLGANQLKDWLMLGRISPLPKTPAAVAWGF